jgi:hypothetical protein
MPWFVAPHGSPSPRRAVAFLRISQQTAHFFVGRPAENTHLGSAETPFSYKSFHLELLCLLQYPWVIVKRISSLLQ